MARTTVGSIKDTFDTSVSDAAIQQWMEVANELVDDVSAAGNVSASRLEKLERLVAQHLITTQDPRHSSASGASRSVSYQGDSGMYWEGSRYGQQALMLDPTGELEKKSAPSVSFDVVDISDNDPKT